MMSVIRSIGVMREVFNESWLIYNWCAEHIGMMRSIGVMRYSMSHDSLVSWIHDCHSHEWVHHMNEYITWMSTSHEWVHHMNEYITPLQQWHMHFWTNRFTVEKFPPPPPLLPPTECVDHSLARMTVAWDTVMSRDLSLQHITLRDISLCSTLWCITSTHYDVSLQHTTTYHCNTLRCVSATYYAWQSHMRHSHVTWPISATH